MKALVLVIGFCFLNFISFSQSLSWVKSLYGNTNFHIQKFNTDHLGNIYIVGGFTGAVDFDPGPASYIMNSTGISSSNDGFIVKLTPEGSFVWAGSIGGLGSDFIRNILVDGSGSIYISGEFKSTADLDPGASILNFTAQDLYHANGDIFISKLSPSGDLAWVKIIGSPDNNSIFSMDFSGNSLVMIVSLDANTDYDPGPGVFQLSGISNYTVVEKLDLNGDFLWAKAIPTSNVGLSKMSFDATGGIYLTGSFAGQGVDFDPGPATFLLNSNGWEDIFICKLLGNGNFVWARSIGGGSPDNPNNIALDTSGNVYVCGSFENTLDFDPGIATVDLISQGDKDIFLLRLDNNGTFSWVKQIGGALNQFAESLKFDSSGNLYVSGNLYGTADFDPGPGQSIQTASGSTEVFILKLDRWARFDWVRITKSQGSSFVKDFLPTGGEGVLVSGNFSGTVDFDPGPGLQTLTSVGTNGLVGNVFFWKLAKSGKITGNIYLDANGDGIRQVAEAGLSILVQGQRNTLVYHTVADSAGNYVLNVDTGAYHVSVIVPPYYIGSIPASYLVNFGSVFGGTANGRDFGALPTSNFNDLQVSLTAVSVARAGRESAYRLCFKNVGTTVLSGNVKLVADSRTSLVSANPAPASTLGGMISWNFTNLGPSQFRYIDVLFLNATTLIFSDTLKYIASISPLVGDTTPVNNVDTLSQQVIGSYDPNDKQVFPKEDIKQSFLTTKQKLDYTIRFQNTGNDTAFLIVVRDTLSHLLDWSSIEMISASHPYSMDIDKAGGVEWRFDNILLPDSNVNEIKSHGFIRYRIMPKVNMIPGSSIRNKAAIYFDYNAPVITNETVTTLSVITSIIPLSTQIKAWVYPNPAKSVFTIRIQGSFHFRMFDAGGKAIISKAHGYNSADVDISSFSKGIYFLEIEARNGRTLHKMVIQ